MKNAMGLVQCLEGVCTYQIKSHYLGMLRLFAGLWLREGDMTAKLLLQGCLEGHWDSKISSCHGYRHCLNSIDHEGKQQAFCRRTSL